MGPVSVELARLPLGRWNDLELIDDEFVNLNLMGVAVVAPHLRASGAVYDMAPPPARSPERALAGLAPSREEVYDIGAGIAPPRLAGERLDAYFRAEREWAASHRDRPGMPAFKLGNGPPWHITVAECRSVLELGIAGRPLPGDAPSHHEAAAIWEQELRPLLELGAQRAGVMTL